MPHNAIEKTDISFKKNLLAVPRKTRSRSIKSNIFHALIEKSPVMFAKQLILIVQVENVWVGQTNSRISQVKAMGGIN